MDLKMEIYTPSLELIGLLEVQRSVIANTAAFSAGSFSVYSLITDETRDLLQPENIVAISDDAAGIIEHVEEESDERGPYITIKGRLLSGILDRRILWGLYDLTGTPAAIMRYLVNDCAINPTRGKDAEDIERRKIPGLVLADGYVDSGAKIRKQNTGGSLLEALEELGETYQVAFGVRVNPKTQLMEFWTRNGVDRSIHQLKNEPVFFSTELDDVLSSSYTYDSKNYKNIALVAGEGEGLNRTSTVVEKFEETPAPPAVETCTIALTVDPAGTGTVSGGGEVRIGRKTTVKAAPSSGYEFVAWKQGTNTVSTSETYTFTVTEDMTLTAVFAVILPTYHIQTAIDPAGSGTVSGAGYYKQGNTVTLTASPANGFKFVAWRENGANVSTNKAYTFTASESRTITAVFAAVYTVTTSIDPAGSGTATGAGSYDSGTSVTVTATPSTGYKFVAWSVGGVEVSTSASYTFTVSGNTTVTAVFATVPRYTITTEIDPDGSGTVTGAGTYAEGTSVTLTATPTSGYNFVSWQMNGVDVSASASYTFIVSGDKTFTALFSDLPSGYTRLPYLQSNGYQYIDTGIAPDSTTKVIGELEFLSMTDSSVFGSYKTSKLGNTNIYSQFKMILVYGNTVRGLILGNSYSINNIQKNQVYSFSLDADSRNFTFGEKNGVISSSSGSYSYTGIPNIYIFSSNNNGTVDSEKAYMKLYKFTICKNGSKVRDFVPCSNPSGVKGLYDKISKTFFANKGTGSFS